MTDEPFDSDLSPEDEAEVRGMLAALPDPQLPAEVAQRIAALVGASGLADRSPATDTLDAIDVVESAQDPDDGGSTDALPFTDEAEGPKRPRRRGAWVLQSAAVLVIVALIAAVVVGVTSHRDDSSSSKPLVLSEPNSGPVTTSGRTYSSASLAGQVRGLIVAASTGATPTGSSGLPAATTATTATTKEQAAEHEVTTLIENPATRQACIDQLASVPGAHAVAIDVGVYEGKAAAVIVLPDEVDPTKVDAWVVGPTCSSADNPFPYRYQRVPRP